MFLLLFIKVEMGVDMGVEVMERDLSSRRVNRCEVSIRDFSGEDTELIVSKHRNVASYQRGSQQINQNDQTNQIRIYPYCEIF